MGSICRDTVVLLAQAHCSLAPCRRSKDGENDRSHAGQMPSGVTKSNNGTRSPGAEEGSDKVRQRGGRR